MYSLWSLSRDHTTSEIKFPKFFIPYIIWLFLNEKFVFLKYYDPPNYIKIKFLFTNITL